MIFTSKPFVIFFFLTSLLFSALIFFSKDYSATFYSIGSQLLIIIFVGLFFKELILDVKLNEELPLLERKFSVFQLFYFLENKRCKKIVFSILFFTLFFGFLNAWLIIYERANINESQKNILATMLISTLGITQFGGWFFQTVLIFMLSTVMGAKKRFNTYLKIMGISYFGFLVLSIFTLILNYFSIPKNVSLNDFNLLMKDSPIYLVAGKSGEFLVLATAAAGISNYEKFSPMKSLLICCVPSMLLLLFKSLFGVLI